jgi:diguanylate cyclase (GGDEF)-like protein
MEAQAPELRAAVELLARRTGGRCRIERVETHAYGKVDRAVLAAAGTPGEAGVFEVPLRDVPGVLVVEPAEVLTAQDVELAEVLAGLVGALLGSRDDALFDPLTGVGNRRHWTRLLEAEESRARRHGVPASVVVLDLDDMKERNDRDGHAAGDALLRKTGAILHDVCRGHDVVARLGGDEFGVLAVGCGHDDAEALAARIGAALTEHGIAASIGFAGRHPAGGLLHAWRRADARMYEAKRSRRADEIDLRDPASPGDRAQRAG